MGVKNEEQSALDLVGHIYDAALDPEHWQVFLQYLAQTLDGHTAMFRFYDTASNELDYAAAVGLDEAYIRAYHDYFITVDPLLEKMMQAPEGKILGFYHALPEKDYIRTEYYNDYHRPNGIHHLMGGHLVRQGSRVARFGVHRPKNSQPFGDTEKRFMARLVPHLQRAFQISRQFAGLQRERDGAMASLDRLPIGVILVDKTARPVFFNHHADEIMQSCRGLALSATGMTAALPRETAAFQKLIREAIDTGNGTGLGAGGVMMLSTPSGKASLSVVVAPLKNDRAMLDLSVPHACAVVFVTIAERRHDFPLRVLSALYGLTPAEARLAKELANGSSLEEIAERYRITKNTVRNQLRAVFNKTGTRRQTEIVRLILNSAATLAN